MDSDKKAVANYLAEKAEAEKERKGMFWLNPVFSDAYDGRYKTFVDGEEYRIALAGRRRGTLSTPARST